MVEKRKLGNSNLRHSLNLDLETRSVYNASFSSSNFMENYDRL